MKNSYDKLMSSSTKKKEITSKIQNIFFITENKFIYQNKEVIANE